ncbi:MAG: GNAT family N-acetyltransferase [Spirulinaceae cyanobacterium SM2_1_0]|nr:GNAT family N-acetyltransferase [Spirulinaceae cyanobacterium SM2_1_0]
MADEASVTPLTIRQATPTEAVRVAELAAQTFRETFAADNDPADMADYLATRFSPTQIATELADPAATFLLAAVGSTVVGYAKLQASAVPDPVSGDAPLELVRLYLRQAWTGRGYGRALMQACLDRARAEGYQTLWLGVWEHNHRARAFYQRWGFTAVGAHDFWLGRDRQTDLILQRAL